MSKLYKTVKEYWDECPEAAETKKLVDDNKTIISAIEMLFESPLSQMYGGCTHKTVIVIVEQMRQFEVAMQKVCDTHIKCLWDINGTAAHVALSRTHPSVKGAVVSWPKDAPRYHNANVDPCDAWVGPCACGAWHKDGEFELLNGNLYRYCKKV